MTGDPIIDMLRTDIDAVDRSILEGLVARRRIVRLLLERKLERGMELRDEGREWAILDRIREKADMLGIDPDHAERVFREVLRDSLTVIEEVRGGS